jgi:hypothetical protein
VCNTDTNAVYFTDDEPNVVANANDKSDCIPNTYDFTYSVTNHLINRLALTDTDRIALAYTY